MATRQVCAFLCIMFLLLAVASAAAPAPPASVVAPPPPAAAAASAPPPPAAAAAPAPDPFADPEYQPKPGDTAAAGRIHHAHADCYRTVTQVDTECARQFILAMFTGRTLMDFPITAECCHQLACVREWTCRNVLGGVCTPPARDLCPPP